MTAIARAGAMAALVALACAVGGTPAAGQTAGGHDKAFWRAIAAEKYAVPAGADVPALVRELSGHLASTDPEWRDDIAYSTLTMWIYRQRIVPEVLRRELMADWQRNLTRGIGETGGDGVLRRSFSALSLGVLAILDNEAPFLERAEFDEVLAAALAYLRDERDVRGFDETTGWLHSVAHTADLLKFLARSRHLRPDQQVAILTAITDKLTTVETPLIDGEPERLARAVLSIAARPDFDAAAFTTWSTQLAPPRLVTAPSSGQRAARQNRRDFAVVLHAVLATDARNLATVAAARDIVLKALRTIM